MIKKLSILVASILFVLGAMSSVSAQSQTLTVTSIGNLDTSGTFYSDWYYTAQNPTLSGTAPANATVTISIDSTSYNTTATSAGVWSYSPTTLTTGDHAIVVTSGAETVSFTLAIGATAPSNSDSGIPLSTTGGTSTTGATLPVAGVGSVTMMMLVGGLLALGFAGYTFALAKK